MNLYRKKTKKSLNELFVYLPYTSTNLIKTVNNIGIPAISTKLKLSDKNFIKHLLKSKRMLRLEEALKSTQDR